MITPSPQVLEWLSSLIKERFSQRLYFVHDGKLRLQCEELNNSIIFDVYQPKFYQSGHELTFTKWNSKIEGFNSLIDGEYPAPGVNKLPSPLVRKVNENYIISYDIPGLVYWMLNRIEEINYTGTDNHERFPGIASHAYKHGYLDRPIVDEWLDILRQVIHKQWPDLQLKTNKFSINVSHDVDLPARYGFCPRFLLIPRILVDLKRGQVKNACTGLLAFVQERNSIQKKDPFNTFDWIMDLSEKNGLISTFNFICGKTDLQKDADYLIDHKSIRSLLNKIHNRGHEIGLHPSFNTYNDTQALISEADNLRKVCLEEEIMQEEFGSRMHFLRWQHPSTLLALEEAGMSYDSTLGFADLSGFRCGTCYEYPAFDPINHMSLKIRIRPLVVMERSVTSVLYMGLENYEDVTNTFLSLKEKCEKVNGTFSMLWHNNSLITSQEREIYECIIS